MSKEPGRESTSNPHDKLFKAVFGRAAGAADLIRALLPGAAARALDITTIRAEPASSVDARLRERFSDLLYSVGLRSDSARLYVILEHKSAPERLTAYAVTRYSMDIITGQVRERGSAAALPMVISMVIHHGAGGWNAPRALHELYRGPARVREALGEYLHGGAFLLYDVALDSDAALRQRGMSPLATLTLWVLARARASANIAADLCRVIDLFQRVLEAPDGIEDVVMLIRYILDVSDVPLEALEYVFTRAFGHRAQEVSMITTGERLREEGRQQGRQTFLLMQLETRFGALSSDVIQRVNAADVEALDVWGRRVLTAAELADVFAAPATP
jgi:predicted transposase YdaD